MGAEPLTNTGIDAIHLAYIAVHLLRALNESRLELLDNAGIRLDGHVELLALHRLQMLHRHLKYVGLLQFGMTSRLKV